MKYAIRKEGDEFILEKYSEQKGFFQNIGASKVGEIKLYNLEGDALLEEFLTDEFCIDLCWAGLTSVEDMFFFSYRGPAQCVCIGNQEGVQDPEYPVARDFPIEERIKFLYEALNSNTNYNCLGFSFKNYAGTYTHYVFAVDYDENRKYTIRNF